MLGKVGGCTAFVVAGLMIVSQIGCRACGTCYDYSSPVQDCGCETTTDDCGCSSCNSSGQRHSTSRRASALNGGNVMMTEAAY